MAIPLNIGLPFGKHPTDNTRGRKFYEAVGYQLGYIMPRHYENELDGVTYQKFFEPDIR